MNARLQAESLHHHERLKQGALGALFAAVVLVLLLTWF